VGERDVECPPAQSMEFWHGLKAMGVPTSLVIYDGEGHGIRKHKYQDAPAKYLTAPNAASGDPAVRFEIGSGGKVSLIHVGIMPALGYVEGCS
jgi:hypothetical protein